MENSQQRVIIKITFPIIITLYTFLIYLIILVLQDNKNVDYGLFSLVLIVIGGLIGFIWRFLPLRFKFNFVAQGLYSGYVNGEGFLNKVTYTISSLTLFIGVLIGFINYVL